MAGQPGQAGGSAADGDLSEAPGAGLASGPEAQRVEVTMSVRNAWRIGLVLLAVVALGLFVKFVLNDGGALIFTVLMSWFTAIAMAPLVNRLSRHMRRGAATGLVIGGFALFVVLFLAAFGSLFVGQLAQLIRMVPDLIEGTLTWVNATFDMALTQDGILSSLNLTPDKIAEAAATVGVSFLGLLGSAVGAVFSLFTLAMFVFYMSADMPQLERWIGSLFPPSRQTFVATVWRLTAEKTGGYVGARVILAGINAATTAIVFLVIGMPYWLPLSLWTGIVAQFVPTIGTYISIALPVVVGLLSPNPWVGVLALVWALVYQQVENLTIEPKVSSKAVDVNPAVSFGAVLLGAALFGVAGAFLAVPVVAMLLALLDIYGHRYELTPSVEHAVATAMPPREPHT